MKNNILVLGDGLLGSEIIKQTGWNYISRKKDNFDIRNKELYKFSEFDIIINCIANTDTYSNDKKLHWDVNYSSIVNLVDYCNKYDIKLVHISTDYVYTNSKTNASEDDVPIHGDNWYSYTKLLADAYIELKCKNYLICRTSHKPNPFPYNNAWVDLIGNFDYVNVISSLIIELIYKNCNGIFNVGTQLKSMYSLAYETNKNIIPSLKPKYTPSDISINLNKLKKTLKK